MRCEINLTRLLLSITLVLTGERAFAEGSSPRPPNILWIMADQLRWDCVSPNGNTIIKTPALEQLAKEGANFTHAFVQSPVCVPSRASFFTGRYPHSHRNRVNYTPLKADEVLLPALLKREGYATGLVGKTNLYYAYPPTPDEARRTGFDLIDLHDAAGETDQWSDYLKWRNANDPNHDVPLRRPARLVPRLKGTVPADVNPNLAAIDVKYNETTWTGVRTRERMKELAATGKPWFLFSSYWKPHMPYEVSAPYDAMYSKAAIPLPPVETRESLALLPDPVQKLILRGRPEYQMDRTELEWLYRSYYGTITQVDDEVGRTLAALKEMGLADNTIVVFTSDHGDQLLEHGLLGKNVFFEGSVRVPLMMWYPGHIQPGSHDELVEAVDVLPTLYELAGMKEPANCQGRSLAALIDGSGRKYQAHEAVFAENIIPEIITNRVLDFSFEKGKGVKGVRHPDAKMVRTKNWKFNHYPDGYAELYDIEHDPGERKNLAADPAYKQTLEQMKGRLLNWLITADEGDQIAPRWLIP